MVTDCRMCSIWNAVDCWKCSLLNTADCWKCSILSGIDVRSSHGNLGASHSYGRGRVDGVGSRAGGDGASGCT